LKFSELPLQKTLVVVFTLNGDDHGQDHKIDELQSLQEDVALDENRFVCLDIVSELFEDELEKFIGFTREDIE
jgi:hypothetical protein